MQNATIQINAMSGMGDIFCDIYIAVIIANAFKKEDCNTDLKFYWGPHPVDNKKIFDDSFFDNFNSVETIDKPITESNYGDQKHIGFSGKAGIHHYDVFTNSTSSVVDKFFARETHVSATKCKAGNIRPKNVIKFSTTILDKVETFIQSMPEDHCFMHIRKRDHTGGSDKFSNIEEKLCEYIDNNFKNKNIHLGSDDLGLVERISNSRDNVYHYDFSSLKTYKCNVQAERFEDVLAEMISVKYCNKIYLRNDYPWVSNFLYYGFTHGNQKPVEKIQF